MFCERGSCKNNIFKCKIAWRPVRKCGSSLINALIHLPGVCPLAHNLVLDEKSLGACWLEEGTLNPKP